MIRRIIPALLALAMAAGATASAPAPETLWYLIVAGDGTVIGHSSLETVERADGRDVINAQEIAVQDADRPPVHLVERTVFRLDAQGQALSIGSDAQSGSSRTQVDVRIEPGMAMVTRTTRSGRRTMRVALPPGIRFDAGAGLLQSWDPAATPVLEFRNFDIDAAAVERMTIERAPDAAPAADGSMLVLRKRYDGGDLRSVARLTLDRERTIASVVQPLFGTTITTRATDRETALQPHRPYPLVANSLIKSPFRIGDTATLGHMRYRFAFRENIAFAPPETGEQRVAADADGVTLDVCPECGPGLPSDPAALADALKPTAWMQSDHPRIRAIARRVARLHFPEARKMEMLRDIARTYIERIEFAGHYSALETIDRRAGDCTEAAVLLAALARAAGIPARVANGLVYSRPSYHGVSNVFMPHSWVIAWADGQWRGFDAALPQDSTHIALTIGDGDPRSIVSANQLAGLLRWETMTEVRVSPAP
jgi:transglutaminase-like putative cysteine protease